MKKKNKTKVFSISYAILLSLCIGYFVFSIFFMKETQFFNIINSFLIIFLVSSLFMNQLTQKNIYKIFTIIFVIGIISCNILNNYGLFTKKVILLENFTRRSVNEILKWGEENNINIEQIYEFSDNIDEFNIISQDIAPNTPIEGIETIKLIVSSGPNYDKIVIIPNLVGSDIEELIKTKNQLLLNNVIINYVKSDEKKDTIISQSLKGQYSRNTQVTFEVSLGNEENTEIQMIDLTNKTLFDASLWLKQNSINYEITYEFSDISKNTVLSQDIKAETNINIATDKIHLVVSKGKSITVPNLSSMTNDEIVNWISDNNLKVEFSEIYHTSIPLGNIVNVNYNEGDIIEDGTLIKITTSKGQIKFPKVNTLQELKTWANKYNIIVNEEYATNNTVAKGNIVSATYKENDIVDPNKPISVIISTGKPITVPNFYNMSKNVISNKCYSLGLICTFYESSYSNIAYNNAIGQSVAAGATVTSGKTISIALSKGPAKTFTVKISAATIQSCIGDANCTINNLKSYFNTNYPGVTFNFTTATSSTFNNAGFIHENSNVTDGTKVTQGNTYKVIITK